MTIHTYIQASSDVSVIVELLTAVITRLNERYEPHSSSSIYGVVYSLVPLGLFQHGSRVSLTIITIIILFVPARHSTGSKVIQCVVDAMQ